MWQKVYYVLGIGIYLTYLWHYLSPLPPKKTKPPEAEGRARNSGAWVAILFH